LFDLLLARAVLVETTADDDPAHAQEPGDYTVNSSVEFVESPAENMEGNGGNTGHDGKSDGKPSLGGGKSGGQQISDGGKTNPPKSGTRPSDK
jgi:hypothetical protein